MPKRGEKEQKEQPAREVRRGNDDDDDVSYDDDEDDCLPCLSCWQIIAIGVVIGCFVIAIIAVAVVLFVGGSSDSSDAAIDYPPETLFQVEVENEFGHGTLGGGTYQASFTMKDGDRDRKGTSKPTHSIKSYFSSEVNGVANMEIDVIIDFDLDGRNDCNDVFYPSAVIDSGEFGAWTKEEACTYTLGGQYLHKTRVKVTSL